MKIRVKNLGALKQAEFEIGDLTIICGANNTGKTYATYALFGFLSFWKTALSVAISDSKVARLLEEGAVSINIQEYIDNAPKIIEDGCKRYVKQLPNVFASNPRMFEETEFQVKLDHADLKPVESFEMRIGAAKNVLFSISKARESVEVVITLLAEKDKIRLPRDIIKQSIGDAIKDIIFGRLFPHPFIASAERTGAAIFRKELNFARNRLLEQMSSREKKIDPIELLTKVYADYALPVKTNVDFTRQLEGFAKRESFISREHPQLLDDFTNIIGGEYSVTRNDELYYIPKGKRIKLTMDESSSAVRSLLDIGFYLRHAAQRGDLLMVDEPELNLHPENQRRVARLFARLVNIGVKVFITTHSDYIIKELNTLIMLNHDRANLKKIMEEEGYKPEELINPDTIRVYIAEEAPVKLDGRVRKGNHMTLVDAEIDTELGIEARSFDKTIDEMNRIQEAILFSGEEQESCSI
ncbi:MAG: AAA family ATPase [Syntrophobacteraceae bacterium]